MSVVFVSLCGWLSVSLCLSFCFSVYLSVSLCLFVSLSFCLPLYLPVCLIWTPLACSVNEAYVCVCVCVLVCVCVCVTTSSPSTHFRTISPLRLLIRPNYSVSNTIQPIQPVCHADVFI